MTNPNPYSLATRTVEDLHIRLSGPVSCRAYSIGPVAVRLGSTTIVIEDRSAALSLASVAVWFEDVADHLGPTYAGRGMQRQSTEITSLVSWSRPQPLTGHHIIAGYRAEDRCGTASLTIGHIRITVCDREAATVVADAFASAYDDATEVFKHLRPLLQVRETTKRHRVAQITGRPVTVR